VIPIAVILAALQAATEALKAWNALNQQQRDTIVARWIDDDAKRREDWQRFLTWFSGIWTRVRL
jgi:acyl-CoA reductase-like NAD-dependent aldehyde dehydrogenase